VTIGALAPGLVRTATGRLTAVVEPLALVTIFAPAPFAVCLAAVGIPGFVPIAMPPRAPRPMTVAPAANFALLLFMDPPSGW
jgi:hypothetical protein